MTKYSTEFKEAAVRKMMPPNAMPVRDVRQETGVTAVTLYKWRNEYRSKGIAVPGDDIKPDNWKGQDKLAVALMYGSGLRVSEEARLRIQDVDLDRGFIIVREAKGLKSRQTLLPQSLRTAINRQLQFVSALHQRDLEDGFGTVYLPYTLARKYPDAETSPGWQYLFPAAELSTDPRSGIKRRHHVTEQTFQRAVRIAIRASAIHKKAGCHTFRHSFATRLLEQGTDLRSIMHWEV